MNQIMSLLAIGFLYKIISCQSASNKNDKVHETEAKLIKWTNEH